MDDNLDVSKAYRCKACGSIIDRDMNAAAKNMLLIFLIEQSSELTEVSFLCVTEPEADESSQSLELYTLVKYLFDAIVTLFE